MGMNCKGQYEESLNVIQFFQISVMKKFDEMIYFVKSLFLDLIYCTFHVNTTKWPLFMVAL